MDLEQQEAPPAYPGLIDELAQARKSATQAPVTLADCRRAMAFMKQSTLVENAAHIRNYELFLRLTCHRGADRRQGVASKSLWDRHDRRRGPQRRKPYDVDEIVVLWESAISAFANALEFCIRSRGEHPSEPPIIQEYARRLAKAEDTREAIIRRCAAECRMSVPECCGQVTGGTFDHPPECCGKWEPRTMTGDECADRLLELLTEPTPRGPAPKWDDRVIDRGTDRRQGLPAPVGQAIVSRAAGDRRHSEASRADWSGVNRRTHHERRFRRGPRPPSGFDTRERRSGDDRRKAT